MDTRTKESQSTKGVFTKFRRECAAHDQNDSWPTPFSRALCHALLEAGIPPGDLSRRTGFLRGTVRKWINGTQPAWRSSAELIEKALDLRPGTLTVHTGQAEEVVSKRSKDVWNQRRKNAGTLEKRRELVAQGKYGGLTSEQLASEARKYQARGAPHITTFSGRLNHALRRVCMSGHGSFHRCLFCRQPVYYMNSNSARASGHWHQECEYESGIKHPGYRPPNEPGPSIDLRIKAALMFDGLGFTHSQICQQLLGYSDDLVIKSMQGRVRDGRDDLKGLSWGYLFPLQNRPHTSVHALLKDYSIDDGLRVARGEHPLSNENDMLFVARWAPEPKPKTIAKVYVFADAPLAQALGKALDKKFSTLAAAEKSTGIPVERFRGLLDNRQQYIVTKTIPILSELMDLEESELRELIAESGQPSSRLGRKRPDLAGPNHWSKKRVWVNPRTKEQFAKQAIDMSHTHLMKRQEWPSPFAQGLTEAILSKGITQGQLGALIGVRRDAVSRWTRIDIVPKKEAVEKIEKALGLVPNSLESLIPIGERERRQALCGSKRKLAAA